MKKANFLKLIIALIIPQIFAIIGSLFTQSSMSDWYLLLEKPVFNPPNWLFGPVWTFLYLLMGIAAFLIWRRGLDKKEVRFSLIVFLFQLSLNLFWSFIFFSLKNPGIAFTEIISLWFAILATIIAFYQIHKKAAYLLIPYLLWVSFAAFLNFSIWQLNGAGMNSLDNEYLIKQAGERYLFQPEINNDFILNQESLPDALVE